MTGVLVDVVEARATGERRLYLRFEDGVAGEVDLDRLVRWEGVFEPLLDPQRFSEVRVVPSYLVEKFCQPKPTDPATGNLAAPEKERSLNHSA